MSTLPQPPPGWPAMLTVALQQVLTNMRADFSEQKIRTTQAGRLNLSVKILPLIGELPCDGAKYLKDGLPDLALVCGTSFNTGGELATEFRVPNVAAPNAALQWRISTG